MENPQEIQEMNKEVCNQFIDEKELKSIINGMAGAKQLLGSGGQGQVYKMKTEDGKCFYAGKTSTKELDKSLVKESNVLSKLVKDCGDYVLCFVGFHTIDNNYWVFTEYVENFIELLTFTNAGNKLNIELVANLIKGLQLLHDKGVAHLDIKPENILINSKTNEIRYIDFGLACMSEEICIPSGTGHYLSPEVYDIKDFESAKKQDIWSLGVMIWVCFHKFYLFSEQDVKLHSKRDKTNKISHWMQFVKERFETYAGLKPEYLRGLWRMFNIDLNDFINMDPKKRILRFLKTAKKV